jgi:hypothetical protein
LPLRGNPPDDSDQDRDERQKGGAMTFARQHLRILIETVCIVLVVTIVQEIVLTPRVLVFLISVNTTIL